MTKFKFYNTKMKLKKTYLSDYNQGNNHANNFFIPISKADYISELKQSIRLHNNKTFQKDIVSRKQSLLFSFQKHISEQFLFEHKRSKQERQIPL